MKTQTETTSIYTFPALPRQAGTYQMYCPTCAKNGVERVVKVQIRKVTDRGLVRWAYRAVSCRKCGDMRLGLLPAAWSVANTIGTLPAKETQS